MALGTHLFVLAMIVVATLFALFAPVKLVHIAGVVLFGVSMFLGGAFVALFAV